MEKVICILCSTRLSFLMIFIRKYSLSLKDEQISAPEIDAFLCSTLEC